MGFQSGTLASQNRNKTDERSCAHPPLFKHSEMFSLHCDLQSGQELLWSRKMNSVAVLDNVPVLPADSLRQYIHIKK